MQKEVLIIALAAVGLPVIIRLLMEFQKHLAHPSKTGKNVATAK